MYLEDCWLNSFASPLNSITIVYFDHLFDCDKLLNFFKNIDISKGWVYIYGMYEDYSVRDLVNAINSFPKANTIKFVRSRIGCRIYGKEIKFEGIEVKNVVFEYCYIYGTNIIKKVFADSGLAENLDTISFYKNKELGKSVIKEMKEIFKKIWEK